MPRPHHDHDQPFPALGFLPACGVLSLRVHSQYSRTLGDLPWQGRAVTLQVQACRFRCLNPSCSRHTFAECLTGVAPRSARRTGRLGDLQRCLAFALGGAAGARMAERLAMPVSADTLLRMLGTGSDPDAASGPRVLAVDDWAWRRGQIARLLMCDIKALAETDRSFAVRLLENAPGLAEAIVIANRLNKLLRRDSQENLDQVLDAAAGTALAEFAAGLRRDVAAVQAALDLPWTMSPAEGQINRIKTIKRTMYGRAGFKLLRARVLHTARDRNDSTGSAQEPNNCPLAAPNN